MSDGAVCINGLIPVFCGEEWELFACSGCPSCQKEATDA